MDRIIADDLKNEANDAISSAASGARRKVNDLVDWSKDQAARLKDPAMNAWGSSMDYVKSNPGKTILVTLAVGVVLGSLLTRRRGE